MPEFVTLETSDDHPGVGTILLNRPPMNALNRQVQTELEAAAREATDRSDIKAVVVYGGPKVLAAGADIKEMTDMTFAEMSKVAGRLQRALGSISEIPKPTVAAITAVTSVASQRRSISRLASMRPRRTAPDASSR